MIAVERFFAFILFIQIFENRTVMVNGAAGRPYLETNEVITKVDETAVRILSCAAEDAVCGFLQVNSRGINQQRLCSCPSETPRCSLTWDEVDGRSITQGGDQYKFCGKAPTLSACETNQPAYTSRLVINKSTGEKYTSTDRMHCHCPEKHDYVLAHQKWNLPGPNSDTEAVEFSYTCAPLPVCKMGDFCKMLSEKSPEFLVTQKCLCPQGWSCPTEGNSVRTFHSGSGSERIDMLRCQRLTND